ncbi:MAG: hypothetical protein IPL75_09075 [Acidobacteria bacterium]|jgi:hypothetical protein|nr:hypothetical protein [Acidobacteriota bacterium]
MKTPSRSFVLTIRLSNELDRRLSAEAGRQGLTRSATVCAILDHALRKPLRVPAAAARRQSILASGHGADRDTETFIEQLADDRDWR